MALLDGFLEGVVGYLGQQEAQNSQTALQLALEKRRRMWSRQDKAEARQQSRADFVEQQNLQGMQPRVGVDEQGRPSLLRDQYGLDDQGAMTRTIERVGDAPRVKEGKPIKIETGDSIEWRQYYNDGSHEVLNEAGTPRYKPNDGSGGAAPRPRYKVMYDPDGTAKRINLDDLNDIQSLGRLQSSFGSRDKGQGGGTTPSAERAELNWLRGRWADLDKVKPSAKPEAQKASIDSILQASGIDPQQVYGSLPDPPMTDPWFGEAQPDEGARMKSYQDAAKAVIKQVSDARLGKGGNSRPGSSEDNPIDAPQTEPPPGTWVRLPSGRVIQTQ